MLSKQLQKQIEQEAIDGQQILPATEYGLGINKGYEAGYEAAGDKYGQLYETAIARAERAERALKEISKWQLTTSAMIKVKHLDILKDIMQTVNEALTPKTGEDE